MRLVRYHQHGGPEVLQVEQADEPQPGPGQLQIRPEVIAASFVDTTMRSGTHPFGATPLPGAPHGEVVGAVTAVGAGVDPSRVGERVAVLALEAWADSVVADAEWAVTVPAGVSADDATVLAMAAPVALLALDTGRAIPGETVLVHSAAGSIGHLAVQLARLHGAKRVIGTVGSAAKVPAVRTLGADEVVVLADGWGEQVRAAYPDGVDVILDAVGGDVTATGLDLLAAFGRLVLFGAAGGSLPQLPIRPLFDLRTVSGFGLLAHRAADPDRAREHLAELTDHVETGRLRALVAGAVALDDPAQAHVLLEDRGRVGRVLLRP